MGPVLTVHLAVRIRDNEHQGPAQSFMHRSYPTRVERSHVHMYKWWSRIRWSFMRDERWEPWEPSRKRDECRMVSSESVFWVRLENGQDIDRLWEKEQFQMEEKLWRKQGLLLFDSGTQPSSARASHLAHINHFSSLLRGASTLSLHHRWRALDVLLDGWHQTSITIS